MASIRHPHNMKSIGTIIQKTQEGREHGDDSVVPQGPEHFGEDTDLAVGHCQMRNLGNISTATTLNTLTIDLLIIMSNQHITTRKRRTLAIKPQPRQFYSKKG